MPRHVRSACLPIVLSLGVIASVGATAVPAAASAAETGITVFLKAPDLAGLQRLAATHGLSHAQRIAAVRNLLPSAAQHQRVERALKADGLTVTHETAWSVSATGPATDVDSAFGVHPMMRAHATPAQRRAATGPYPSLPASLRGDAAAVFPTTGGPAMFHNNLSGGLLIGSDFRNANGVPNRALDGGSDSKATLTIATVQFAGWNAGDLTNWAATPQFGVSGFNPATQMTMVPVDQSAVPAPSTADDSDTEVDLDQEAILSTDPFAHQRPYFAPNTGSGYFDAVSQVLDDVMQDSNAYNGGDPHIVALSSSWGLCEIDNGSAFINALEPVLASLTAAGVTVFASSGDDGIYDGCSVPGPHVDYPASSPEVVGVGGTNLAAVGNSAPNNGSNWLESAWTCVSSSDCDQNGGSGGGVSGDATNSGFAKPDYQGVVTSAPYSQSTKRMVPDIAADGDPNTGFPIYTSDAADVQQFGSNYLVEGGTSLAAPLSASLFTDALAAHAATSGVGDIHSALYAAYAANDGSFRDITTGTNGAAADAGGDPSVNAAVGYDTVSGLGAPLWANIVDRILTPIAAPTATAALALTQPHSSSPYAVEASWTGTAAGAGLALQGADVQIKRLGQSSPVYSNQAAPASGSYDFTAKPGSTYTLSVTVDDMAGTPSSTQTATLVVPVDDNGFLFHGSWQHVADGNAVGGTFAQTSHRGAASGVAANGKAYTLLVRTGPTFGKLGVAMGGSPLGLINLYSARPGYRRVLIFKAGAARTRDFEFVCLGKKSGASRGTTVGFDALYVTR